MTKAIQQTIELNFDDYKLTPEEKKKFIEIKTLEDLSYLLEDLNKYPRVAFDTETTGLSLTAEVFGVSFCVGKKDCSEYTCYWFNFHTCNDERLKKAVILTIEELFTKDNWSVLFHNAAFDIKMVRNTWGIEFTHDNINDTFLLACVLNAWQKNELGLVSLGGRILGKTLVRNKQVEEFFTKAKINKDERNYSFIPPELIFPYACEDVETTFLLFNPLLEFYKKEEQSIQTIYKLERQFAKAVADMEYNGMVIDLDYFKNLQVKLTNDCKKLMGKIQDRFGINFNPNSTQQLYQALHTIESVDVSLIPKTEKNNPSIKTDWLIRTYRNVPELFDIIEWKKKSFALRTFINPILENCLEENNVVTIHTNYWQILETGRLSSKDINLQNITNDSLTTLEEREYSIRRGFKAPPNYLYLKMDFKQFEVRILANACQDPLLLEHQRNNIDFHSVLAAAAFHRPYEDFANKVDEEAKTQRTLIKKASFLFIYGGGVQKCIDTVNTSQLELTVQDAYAIKDAVNSTYAEMNTWRYSVTDEVEKTGKVYTLCGRLRRIEPHNAYGQGVNTICQGTAADVLKFGQLECWKILKGTRSKQIATIHDEAHFYIHENELDLIPKLVAAMETKRFDVPEYVPLVMELGVGTNWGNFIEMTLDDILNGLFPPIIH